jgi:type IX secretion system PorP/SprF family membrane protein
MKKIIYSFFIFCSVCLTTYGQDIHFSQIQESPLWLNPANTGFSAGYFRAIANYRSQWAAMGNAYQTMALSLDGVAFKTAKKKSYMGFGLFVFNDKAGVAKMGVLDVQLSSAVNLQLSKKSKMSAGILAGFTQNTGSFNSLTYGNQFNGEKIDNNIASGENPDYGSFFSLNSGVGVNYEFSNASVDMVRDDLFKLKIGGAVHHLNRPVQQFNAGSRYILPMRFVGNIQARIDVKGTKWSLLPSAIYLKQASASEITLGTHVRYRFKNGTKITGAVTESGINIGVYYRVGDAIIPQLNLDMGKYAIGLSYDVNISKYKQVSYYSGGFEIYLKFMMLDDALYRRKRDHGLQ